MVLVRQVSDTDAASILSIYAPYIVNTVITFEEEVPSPEEYAQRISKVSQKYPWLVCEVDGAVVAYVYASIYRERAAYQWSCECSVYVAEEYKGKGIGAYLYNALFAILKEQRFHTVYAIITLPNDASVRLHEKLGFQYFAVFEKVGYKLGGWQNVGWWRLAINSYEDQPSPPVLFADLPLSSYQHLLSEAAEKIKQALED